MPELAHESRPNTPASQDRKSHRVCPWWIGYLLASPLRRLFENPNSILAPHVKPGMTVLDLGCAMGFFTLPLARLVGPRGRVVGVDVQERMIETLAGKIHRQKLDRIIETRICAPERLGLDDLAGIVDFALAYHVVHEVPDQERFFLDIAETLRPDGRLLLAEPSGHVSDEELDTELELARWAGLTVQQRDRNRRSTVVLFGKAGAPC
ncbi:MAG: methyltransferase domain-containing protein [bacterium]